MPTIMVPLVFRMLIVGNPDGGWARVLSFIQFSASTTMIFRLGAADISAMDGIGSLVITILGGIVMLGASARVFWAGLLIYGQRLSLKVVFSALRQAG
jgi:ABC-type Na+ efflux pump permease subunit